MDPADIDTLPQLAEALDQLRGRRSHGTLGKAAATLAVHDAQQPTLPSSTVSDLRTGQSMPSLDTVMTFLTVCAVDTVEARQPWLAACEPVAARPQRRPSGAVRAGC